MLYYSDMSVSVCVCNLHTHTLVYDCFHVVWLFDCHTPDFIPMCRLSPRGCFFSFSSVPFSSVSYISSLFTLSSTTKIHNRRECGLVQNHCQIF